MVDGYLERSFEQHAEKNPSQTRCVSLLNGTGRMLVAIPRVDTDKCSMSEPNVRPRWVAREVRCKTSELTAAEFSQVCRL